MPIIDHTDESLSIAQMVYNRLTFLEETDSNTALLSDFTLELMYEFEPCFQIDPNEAGGLIGHEQNYSVVQQGIIADVISCYILMLKIGASLAGDVEAGTEAQTTFLTKAKAGSVEVEYDQFDAKKGGMGTSSEQLLAMYKKSAMRKARTIGCILDICDDCTAAVELMQAAVLPKPFVVITNCGCSDC